MGRKAALAGAPEFVQGGEGRVETRLGGCSSYFYMRISTLVLKTRVEIAFFPA
jgi:hypothetical protein